MILGSFIVLTTTNLVSVLVPIMVLLSALLAGLAFFIFRHKKLQRSFSNFANSHYDTRSGSTTFGGADGLGKLFIYTSVFEKAPKCTLHVSLLHDPAHLE